MHSLIKLQHCLMQVCFYLQMARGMLYMLCTYNMVLIQNQHAWIIHDISKLTVTMPILSFTGIRDILPYSQHHVAVYCVETMAIHEYAFYLAQCLPPLMENVHDMHEKVSDSSTSTTIPPSNASNTKGKRQASGPSSPSPTACNSTDSSSEPSGSSSLTSAENAFTQILAMQETLNLVEGPLDPAKELARLISERKYEEAFTGALQRSDLSIVSWLCSQVDLHRVTD